MLLSMRLIGQIPHPQDYFVILVNEPAPRLTLVLKRDYLPDILRTFVF
jgi:hypothetical protein